MPAKRARSDYFPRKRSYRFISTGCTLLNCALTGRGEGGWVLGRVVNVVGDRSVGKTLLAIETCANFAKAFPRGHIWYREAEGAFDVSYAESIGLPVGRVHFGPEGPDSLWDTLEDVGEDLDLCIAKAVRSKQPGLYIVDSYDALTSRTEQARKIGEATYGTDKAKLSSEIFRRGINRRLREANVLLLIISQIRDKIGASFGVKYTRAGGKALDFYSSHILFLHHVETISETYRGIKRATAVQIRAKCTKNKVALPFRECEFILRFGFGVDDLEANLDWLEKVKRVSLLGLNSKEAVDKYFRESEKLPDAAYHARVAEVGRLVSEEWQKVESAFKPVRKKYG
jgi:recombination protein RecA